MEFIATDEVRTALREFAEAHGLEVVYISAHPTEMFIELKKAQMGFLQEELPGEDDQPV